MLTFKLYLLSILGCCFSWSQSCHRCPIACGRDGSGRRQASQIREVSNRDKQRTTNAIILEFLIAITSLKCAKLKILIDFHRNILYSSGNLLATHFTARKCLHSNSYLLAQESLVAAELMMNYFIFSYIDCYFFFLMNPQWSQPPLTPPHYCEL